MGGGDGTSTIMDTCMRLLLRGLAQGFAEQLRDGTLGEEVLFCFHCGLIWFLRPME